MLALIAGGDPELRDTYAFSLRRAGLETRQRPSFERCVSHWPEEPADLVLCLQPPADNLIELIQSFRKLALAPLIILDEDAPLSLQVQAVRNGADLLWPDLMDPRLCAAYCASLLRRAEGAAGRLQPNLKISGLSLDPSTRSVMKGTAPAIRLTQLEFRLLHLLMTHNGQVIPIEDVIERVWGYDEYGSSDLVRGLVSRLRGKLGDSPDSPKFIETIPGVGYRFRAEE